MVGGLCVMRCVRWVRDLRAALDLSRAIPVKYVKLGISFWWEGASLLSHWLIKMG